MPLEVNVGFRMGIVELRNLPTDLEEEVYVLLDKRQKTV